MTVVYIINVDADNEKQAAIEAEKVLNNMSYRPHFLIHEKDEMASDWENMMIDSGWKSIDLEDDYVEYEGQTKTVRFSTIERYAKKLEKENAGKYGKSLSWSSIAGRIKIYESRHEDDYVTVPANYKDIMRKQSMDI